MLYHARGNSIYSSYRADTGWTEPVRLNSNVNFGLVQSPSISSDNRKLYFIGWTNASLWDVFVSSWDDTLNDWGPARNLGEPVNTPRTEWTVHVTPDQRTLYYSTFWPSGGPILRRASWNDSLQNWNASEVVGDTLMGGTHLINRGGETAGASVTADGRKLYYYGESPVLEHSFELYVAYWDSLKGEWFTSKRLNINSRVDSTHYPWVSNSGWDRFPSVTPDGRTLYFASRRETPVYGFEDDLFVSWLVVDENGDTVTTVGTHSSIPSKTFILRQNYPNPFNPETVVEYELPEKTHVTIAVYDILGRLVRLVEDDTRDVGFHRIFWDGRDSRSLQVSSGVYFYRMTTPQSIETRKMLLVR